MHHPPRCPLFTHRHTTPLPKTHPASASPSPLTPRPSPLTPRPSPVGAPRTCARNAASSLPSLEVSRAWRSAMRALRFLRPFFSGTPPTDGPPSPSLPPPSPPPTLASKSCGAHSRKQGREGSRAAWGEAEFEHVAIRGRAGGKRPGGSAGITRPPSLSPPPPHHHQYARRRCPDPSCGPCATASCGWQFLFGAVAGQRGGQEHD